MKRSLRGDEARLGAFFATYFAAVGVFAPYFPLYLQSRGLTAFDIGLVLAVAQGMRVVGPNGWGYWADRGGNRLRLLRATALAACVSFAPIFLVGGFWPTVALVFALHLFLTAQIPIAEAIAAAHLRRGGQAAARYGRLRVWGSTGFIVVVLVSGLVFDAFGIAWQPVIALALLALSIVSAWRVRDLAVEEPAHDRVSVRSRLREPRVRWFLLAAALMVFAHGALYTYLSLYLAQLGYSKVQIGLFWVVGVLAEIGFFFVQGRIFDRFGVFAVLGASYVLAALRFATIAGFAHFWLLLVLAQLLHAASFAAHHSASILLVHRWFTGAAAARGQALYISVGYGVGGTAGALVAAVLWSAVGPEVAFLVSSLAAAAGWWAVRKTRRADETARDKAVSQFA